MKYLLLMISLLLSIHRLHAQPGAAIKIGWNSNEKQMTSIQMKAQTDLTFFYESMIRELKKIDSTFPYTHVEFINLGYSEQSNKVFADNSVIATLTPLKYVLYQYKDKAKLIPLFLAKKRGEHTAYYPAIFISNINSKIDSLTSPLIKKIYLIQNSKSGYLAPLWYLYESKIISEPTPNGIKKKGWQIKYADNHVDLVDEIRKNAAIDAIGATWNFDYWDSASLAPVKPLLRYDCFPQDVLVISSALKPYENHIKDWFVKSFKNYSLRKYFLSGANITGIDSFSLEHENGFKNIYAKYNFITHYDEINAAKNKTRYFYIIIYSLIFLGSILFLLIFWLAHKATKSIVESKKKRFSSYTWAAFTAFILLLIEILRMLTEKFVGNGTKILDQNPQLILLIASIILAFISELRVKFANIISNTLQRITSYMDSVIIILKRKSK